jgi:uncharacterized protein (UPF0332 family)
LSLHRELIEQAHFLANRETKNPRQASLRRAVSSAYYALFHLLLYEATHMLFPATPSGLRERASRAFSHGDANAVCQQWAKGNGIVTELITEPIQDELKTIAAALVDLQEERHKADYDLTEVFDKVGVLESIEKARKAMEAWRSIRKSNNAKVFLSSLLLHSKWSKYNK